MVPSKDRHHTSEYPDKFPHEEHVSQTACRHKGTQREDTIPYDTGTFTRGNHPRTTQTPPVPRGPAPCRLVLRGPKETSSTDEPDGARLDAPTHAHGPQGIARGGMAIPPTRPARQSWQAEATCRRLGVEPLEIAEACIAASGRKPGPHLRRPIENRSDRHLQGPASTAPTMGPLSASPGPRPCLAANTPPPSSPAETLGHANPSQGIAGH